MTTEIVRKPIAVEARSRRRLEERLALRFASALPFLLRAILRLPSGSRVRQTLVWRYVRLGIEAVNRGDYEAGFAAYHTNVEANFDRELVVLGFDPVYRGREARISAERRWTTEWSEFRYEPEQLTDLGDGRLFMVGRVKGSGSRSGAVFDHDWSALVTISAGQVIREQVFNDRVRGLEAAGLSE